MEPTTIIIFGATGDLSRRKLIPALYHLYAAQHLPENIIILGFSRQDLGDEGFQKLVHENLPQANEEICKRFSSHFRYVQGNFDEGTSYQSLGKALHQLDIESATCRNKLYYLATPPILYETIFKNIADSGLSIGCTGQHPGWVRIAVEKPFGNDLDTAVALEQMLKQLFEEDQIFRIDHYLGKAALENILAFRFGNSIFEHLWNKDRIERIRITLFETLGLEGRGATFDPVGMLRDTGQNHLLQMLAVTAMEDPGTYQADTIRAARAEVLNHLHLLPGSNPQKFQYEGYRTEPNVAVDSKTDTAFSLICEIDTSRFAGIPIELQAGKGMDQSEVAIQIFFRECDTCINSTNDSYDRRNVITFKIQPNPSINIRFFARTSGLDMDIEPKDLSFNFADASVGGSMRVYDAYERLLLDALRGDQTLFASSTEIDAAWRFITPLVEKWMDTEPTQYPFGTNPFANTKTST